MSSYSHSDMSFLMATWKDLLHFSHLPLISSSGFLKGRECPAGSERSSPQELLNLFASSWGRAVSHFPNVRACVLALHCGTQMVIA